MTVAVVTGASSGIGRAVALRLAARGSAVGLVARGRDRLDAVADEVRALGARAHVVAADVGARAEVEDAVRELREELGPADVLVNNAGMPGGSWFAEMDRDRIARVIEVNFLGAAWATHAVLPDMLARRRGAIVNVASVAGRIGVPGAAVYSASKHAMIGWTEALRHELAGTGVSVGVVNPGPVRTTSWPHEGVSERLVVGVDAVAAAVLRCADERLREITVPRYYAVAPLVRLLAPGVYERALSRWARRRRR